MYTIRNIIESASENTKQKLDVLIVNEFDDSYVESLCLTNHNFYMLESIDDMPKQWNSETKPYNLNIVRSLSEIRSLDCIVCFNRGNAFNVADKISSVYHVNLINVDFASSQLIFPSPINSQVNIEINEAIARQGAITVGISKNVTASWVNQLTGFSITIPHYYDRFESVRTKILIDPNIPQETLSTLPIQLDSSTFTTNKNEACAYMHLWTNQNKLMIDCLASSIPVMCLDSPDMKDFALNKACIILPSIEQLNIPNLKEQLMSVAESNNIATFGLNYIEKVHDNSFFLECWDKLFRYASNLMYLRG